MFVRTVMTEFGLTHYAFNVFLYLGTGAMFRAELKRLVLRPCRKLFLTLPRSYGSLKRSLRTTRTSLPNFKKDAGKNSLSQNAVNREEDPIMQMDRGKYDGNAIKMGNMATSV